MFILEMCQTWIRIIISILFVMDTTITFPLLEYMILMLWIGKKAFLSTIFLVTKVHLWSDTNLDTYNNLHSFCYRHNNHVLLIRIHDIDALVWKKSFFSTIFHIIKVQPWNKTNLDSRNSLHSFCYGQYNNLLLIAIHDLDALELQEMLFFSPFTL